MNRPEPVAEEVQALLEHVPLAQVARLYRTTEKKIQRIARKVARSGYVADMPDSPFDSKALTDFLSELPDATSYKID